MAPSNDMSRAAQVGSTGGYLILNWKFVDKYSWDNSPHDASALGC
jgi:hypothetical protein